MSTCSIFVSPITAGTLSGLYSPGPMTINFVLLKLTARPKSNATLLKTTETHFRLGGVVAISGASMPYWKTEYSVKCPTEVKC